jgi:hypothetical protein
MEYSYYAEMSGIAISGKMEAESKEEVIKKVNAFDGGDNDIRNLSVREIK